MATDHKDDKADKTKIPDSTFTVDADASGMVPMPGVTRLLNRKSLGLSSSAKPEPTLSDMKPPAFNSDPAPVLENTALETPVLPSESSSDGISLLLQMPDAPFEVESSRSAPVVTEEPTAPLKIQPAKPRLERRSPARLIVWDSKQLKAGADPLGRALWTLMQKGAKSALFLSITPTPAGTSIPHFTGRAAIAPESKLVLWTGLKWDPTVVPELWNHFVRNGFAELGPPATTTNIQSNRNVVRGAFGVLPSEWLLLLRAGPTESCRGVLALISEKSLINEVSAVQADLSASFTEGSKEGSKEVA